MFVKERQHQVRQIIYAKRNDYNDLIYRTLVDAIGRLKINAKSLLHDLDSEQYISVVVKFTGGKRINYSLKNSYSARCAAAVFQFNTGRTHYRLHQTVFQNFPNEKGKKKKLNQIQKCISLH